MCVAFENEDNNLTQISLKIALFDTIMNMLVIHIQ
jgi:hypothetical protein